jgi:hypothetical protein
MGTNFFNSLKPGRVNPSGLNMEAKAFGAPNYQARASAGAAGKDLAAASVYKGNKFGGPSKTSAKAAPGPKKV